MAENTTTRALARGLEILRLFDEEQTSLSLTRIAELVGLPLASTHRTLGTLERYGFLERDPETKEFRPGAAALDLVAALFGSLRFPDIARPHLLRLAETTGETATLATLDTGTALVLVSAEGRNLLTVATRPGQRLPLHATAAGRCLLAGLDAEGARAQLGPEPYEALAPKTPTQWSEIVVELDRVRVQGYALSANELRDGVCACAVPVHREGAAPLALEVAMPASRWSEEQAAEDLRALLQEAARALSTRLRYTGG